MNSARGAPPLPVLSGSAVAIDPFLPGNPWPGLALAAARIGIALNDEALDRFARFRDLLLLRNSEFNLTAIRDAERVERILFLDALAIVPTLEAVGRNGSDDGLRPVRLVDVGAGAGFPGLPLKIARPDLDLTLIDATAKKVTFLNEVISELGLESVRAVHGRAEDLGQSPAYRERFDIASARAVATLPVLLEYVVPLLQVGGTALLSKGLQIDEELRNGTHAATALGAKIVSANCLPVEGTRLVVAAKTRSTPAIYPRRNGIPSRGPLSEGR